MTDSGSRIIVTLLTVVVLFNGKPIKGTFKEEAQPEGEGWSTPVILFEVEGEGQIHIPIVVADRSGNVHVFWSLIGATGETNTQLIYYTRLNGEIWTSPVDIVALSQATSPSATVDALGKLHLLWIGSLNQLQTSTASSDVANSALGWSEPNNIGRTNRNACINSDRNGKIHITYPGSGTTGVYHVVSEDRGVIWSSPTSVSPTSNKTTSADYIHVAVSDQGIIHVVWTEFKLPFGWPPIGVFYSKSSDGGQTWTKSIKIAGEGYDQINVVVVDERTIHVAWNGMAGVGGRYHSWSFNGGKNWSKAFEVVPPGQGGTQGSPQLVVDSAGNLHIVTTFNTCVGYSYWQEQEWAKPICIEGEKARASGFIEEAAMAVSAGNQLHVVFWDDRRRLWYTTKTTDAPHIPSIPFATEISNLGGQTIETVAPVVNSSPRSITFTPVPGGTEVSVTTSPLKGISMGVLPVILIVGGILLLQIMRKRGR